MWNLVDDLDALYLEHRRCGRLDANFDGERVWMTCDGCRVGTLTSMMLSEVILLDSRRLPGGTFFQFP